MLKFKNNHQTQVLRKGLGLIIFVITLIAFPVIERSIRAYHKTFFYTLKNFHEYHRRAITPGSGEETVPGAALRIREIVKKRNLSDYNLSVEFSKDGWAYEQTVVLLWPIKKEKKSKFLFKLPTEKIPGCKLLEKASEVSLVFCN